MVMMMVVVVGMSCVQTIAVVNPIEVIKTRLQLQGELREERRQSGISRIYGKGALSSVNGERPCAVLTLGEPYGCESRPLAGRQYKGFLQGGLHILREEGVAGFYKG